MKISSNLFYDVVNLLFSAQCAGTPLALMQGHLEIGKTSSKFAGDICLCCDFSFCSITVSDEGFLQWLEKGKPIRNTVGRLVQMASNMYVFDLFSYRTPQQTSGFTAWRVSDMARISENVMFVLFSCLQIVSGAF